MSDSYLMPTYARQPIAFVRGEGVWLEAEDGDRYLDAISGLAVCNLGHSHPAVTEALVRQASTLTHTSNLYRIPAQEALAARLCEISGMQKAFFCNSGAEANEAAIKLARLHGHRKGIQLPTIIVMESAFHGRTMASLTATGNSKAQAGFEPLLDGFVRVPYDDLDAVRALADNGNIVAVLVEPVQGEGGVHVPHDGYLQGLREICDQHDWLLMLDEVQTGNGRTGHYFACLGEKVAADVITTAKGLANGFPIGACLARGKAAEVLGPGSHGSTYGGNPLGCAVALAVIDTLEHEVMPEVARRGELIRQQLQDKLAGLSLLKNIRGRGLMIGIELDRDCGDIVSLARERRLLVNVTAGRVVRLLPPLIITDAEIAELTDRLADAIRTFAANQEAA